MIYKILSNIYYKIDYYRVFIWKILWANIWKKVRFWKWTLIANPKYVTIWDDCRTWKMVTLEWWTSWEKGLLIWSHVGINRFCWVAGSEDIIIEDYVQLWPNVIILSSDHVTKKELYIRESWYNNAPIIIKEWSWLWANVVVLPWITIWKGVIIWANAVVTKDIPDYAIAWWVPAKIIKYRK